MTTPEIVTVAMKCIARTPSQKRPDLVRELFVGAGDTGSGYWWRIVRENSNGKCTPLTDFIAGDPRKPAA